MAEAEQATASDALDDRSHAFEDDIIRRARKLVEAYDAEGDDISPKELAAGAVYAVARDRYTSEEVESAFGVENISNMRLRFLNQLGEAYYEYAATPINVVRDHADELGEGVVEVAERIFDTWEGWRRSTRKVNTLAAAGTYFAKQSADPELTQSELEDIFGVTETSLRSARDAIRDDLTDEELIKAIHGEVRDIEETALEPRTQNHTYRDPDKIKAARDWLDEQDIEVNDEDEDDPAATVGEDDLTPEQSFVVNETEHAAVHDVSDENNRSKLSVSKRTVSMDDEPQSLAFTPDVWATIQETIRQHSNGHTPTTKLPPRISINRAGNGDYVVEEYDQYIRLPPREWVELLTPVADQQTPKQPRQQA